MSSRVLDARVYTQADQLRFADLSGDFNPIHVDPVGARREIFGEQVVHGVHAMLRALEAWEPLSSSRLKSISRLNARFRGPVFLHQTVETRLSNEVPDAVELQVCCANRTAMTLEIGFGAAPAVSSPPRSLKNARFAKELADPSLPELEHRCGSVPLLLDSAAFKADFPGLSVSLPETIAAEILGITRLVGMECPGRRSILSSIDLEFHGDLAESLTYEVIRVDPRFSSLRIKVRGPSTSGRIDVFQRPPPQTQPSIHEVAASVRGNSHAGDALVVGGSRGLGEVTAKLVAARGGRPVVTYHRGLEDAERVAFEIREAGWPCELLHLDVSNPLPGLTELDSRGVRPTSVYYFASPKIFASKASLFDQQLYAVFNRFYVSDFYATYQACRCIWKHEFALFYPSTVAIDEKLKSLIEYASAKAAGETVAEHLARHDPKLRVIVKRLPRVATDQTATLTPLPAASPLDVMKGVVDEMLADDAR